MDFNQAAGFTKLPVALESLLEMLWLHLQTKF